MLKQTCTSIVDYGNGVPLPMRTLAVAGERQDDVEGTRRLGQVLRGGCDESRAFVVNGAVHAWNLQWPELFAEGIEAWIERRGVARGIQGVKVRRLREVETHRSTRIPKPEDIEAPYHSAAFSPTLGR
jgi:hypothetical protein